MTLPTTAHQAQKPIGACKTFGKKGVDTQPLRRYTVYNS